jgi:hypothetical protein
MISVEIPNIRSKASYSLRKDDAAVQRLHASDCAAAVQCQ